MGALHDTATVAGQGLDLVENPDLDTIETQMPRGFSFGAAHCGIKRSRPDLALLRCTSERGANVAACFTKNAVRAACVRRGARLVPRAGVRAVIVNSGNANAMTGEAGVRADVQMATALAEALDCEPDAVLTNSTGVIGVPLPAQRICDAVPDLVSAASGSPALFARAILTTDTCTKSVLASLKLSGGVVRIFGAAKGSGMVHPNMATTLGYVCTDAAIEPQPLQALLSQHIDRSFNAITVDGDTSTNDTVTLLASGTAEVALETSEDHERFSHALAQVLQALARQVARDGEGATRLLEVRVSGAPDDALAMQLARAVARSSLFKCSVFAGEAQWGRLVAALGQAAALHELELEPAGLEIRAQGVTLISAGCPVDLDAHATATLARSLATPDVRWDIELGLGPASFTAWGCDLSYDYVRINADESAQIEIRSDGRVGRNLSLGTYSPKLKHQLLVDGLGYVRRFAGMRVLVLAKASVLHRPTLLSSWVRDLELLLDAGIRPLLVLAGPGAHEAATRLEAAFEASVYRLARIEDVAAQSRPHLDRGQPCVWVAPELDGTQACALAARLGVGKLLCLDDDSGLRDAQGLVEQIEPGAAHRGLSGGALSSTALAFEQLALEAHRQAVPAIHLIDGRVPHALVAELFTERGVGTLVSHQDPGER